MESTDIAIMVLWVAIAVNLISSVLYIKATITTKRYRKILISLIEDAKKEE